MTWHIQNLVQCFHTQKLGIFEILEYSEPFHNCIPNHIQNPVIFAKIFKYSEPCHIYENLRISRTLTYLKPYTIQNPLKDLRFEFFAKIVRNYNYYSKALYLRSLTGFWIRLFLNKYPLTCRVTWRYVYHDTYSEPWLLLQIQTCSNIFTSYANISSYIVAYLEPCVILVYSEPWHI